ncbi:MAG: leucine-rich repeat domain-containing protein, partial [Eubacterium sp.]|nr:leucine-rich repeat domain-containing protein [Eubacterium sp.]
MNKKKTLLICSVLLLGLIFAILSFQRVKADDVEEYVFENISGGVKITKYNGIKESVTIPSNLFGKKIIEIGDNAFKDNTLIKNLTIPDNIRTIGSGAFAGCTGIESITIPVDVEYNTVRSEEIGKIPSFQGCSSVKKITYTKGETGIMPDRVDGNNDNSGKYFKLDCLEFQNIENNTLKEVIFEEGVTHIGDHAFDISVVFPSEHITSVILPATVTSIGSYTFYGQHDMTISSLENVTEFGSFAFYDCASITELKLNKELTEIPAYTFGRCCGIKTEDGPLIIPESVKVMGSGAFCECDNITEITIPVDIEYDGHSTNSSYYSGSDASTFAGCLRIKRITYTKGKTGKMPDREMYNSSMGSYDKKYYWDYSLEYPSINYGNLKEVIFEEGITHIGDYAFATYYSAPYSNSGGEGITSVILPATVTSIGKAAFSGQDNMTISSLENVTEFGSFAFYDCASITELKLNKELTEIPAYTFGRCCGIKTEDGP